MTITERLQKYMDFKGLNPNKITVEANLSVGLIGKAIKNNRGLNSDTIEKILYTYIDLSPEWFVLGIGEMLKTKSEENDNKKNVVNNVVRNVVEPKVKKITTNEYKDIQENYPIINHNRMPSVITISEKDEEKENIEIVPAKLAAGYVGGGYAEESFVLDLPKFRLPYLNNGTFRCFGVMGHSMEKIQDEDWFVGKFVDNIRNFNEGKIHAVIAPKAESLLIKRVFRHPKKMDTLILRSDSNNESNLYPDIHMPISLIAEMWSYTALISFKEPLFDVMRFKEISKTSPDFIDVKDYFSE